MSDKARYKRGNWARDKARHQDKNRESQEQASLAMRLRLLRLDMKHDVAEILPSAVQPPVKRGARAYRVGRRSLEPCIHDITTEGDLTWCEKCGMEWP